MKKTIFVIGIIALFIGMAFIPAGTSVETELSENNKTLKYELLNDENQFRKDFLCINMEGLIEPTSFTVKKIIQMENGNYLHLGVKIIGEIEPFMPCSGFDGNGFMMFHHPIAITSGLFGRYLSIGAEVEMLSMAIYISEDELKPDGDGILHFFRLDTAYGVHIDSQEPE